MGRHVNKSLSGTVLASALAAAAMLAAPIAAYGPSTMYTPPAGTIAPGALYARAMQASNGKMYATFEQYTTGVAMFPIFESLDSGRTWKKVGDVKDTHKGWGMRWEPQLYELPQAIGSMPAGTLLAAGLVLPYDRSKCEIDLYRSNDEGRTWTFVSTIAVGTQANPGSDPVWEPFLMVVNDKLYCFYSDERDPAYGQKLVHQSTSDGVNWSSVVTDVAISGQRPGMVVVTRMPNGSFLMVYEIVGIGGAYYKTSSNIESWNPSDKGTVFDSKGSSPYAVTMGNTIILSSAGNGNLYTNTNNGAGSWTQISSPIGTGYSRCLVPLNNGRLFVTNAGWNGSGLNSVVYADMAFGCAPTAIVPNIQVDGGTWRGIATDTVDAGSTVVLGPQPVATSGWTWSGPNGFSATTREVTLAGITPAQAGSYTATYTNGSGCKSTQVFRLTVRTSTGVHRIRTVGSRIDGTSRLRLGDRTRSLLEVGTCEVRVFRLDGRPVGGTRTEGGDLLLPHLTSGVYHLEIVRGHSILARDAFLVP